MVPVKDCFFYFLDPLNISDIFTRKKKEGKGKERKIGEGKRIDILYYLNFMDEKKYCCQKKNPNLLTSSLRSLKSALPSSRVKVLLIIFFLCQKFS